MELFANMVIMWQGILKQFNIGFSDLIGAV